MVVADAVLCSVCVVLCVCVCAVLPHGFACFSSLLPNNNNINVHYCVTINNSMAQQPTCTVLCESKCILGESPTWHEHTLYFIDIKQGVIHCYVPEDGTHRILQPKVGEIGAICPIAGDTEHMLACGTHNIVKVRTL